MTAIAHNRSDVSEDLLASVYTEYQRRQDNLSTSQPPDDPKLRCCDGIGEGGVYEGKRGPIANHRAGFEHIARLYGIPVRQFRAYILRERRRRRRARESAPQT